MWSSAVVRSAAQLRLADAVSDEPTDVHDVAVAVGADPDALDRLMRALVAFGIFRQDAPRRYAHTDISRALKSDSPTHALDILLTGGKWGWETWGGLADSVRTGESAFRRIYGKDLFSYLAEDDEDARAYYRGLTAHACGMDSGLAKAIDLTDVKTVVDVGGGSGSLLRALLEHNPNVSGILFDREYVLSAADPVLCSGTLAGRCRMETGNCLEALPAADLYIFRQVLHMWNDETCVQALSRCTAAKSHGGSVVVLEQLISDPPQTAFAPLMDLHMLLVTGGRERTKQEYADLFERAGLRFKGATCSSTPLAVLEAEIPPR
jgi:hypothetical protein